jgi:hypothetical protein
MTTTPHNPEGAATFRVNRDDMALMQSALTDAEALAATGSVTAAAEAENIRQDIARSVVVDDVPDDLPPGTIVITVRPQDYNSIISGGLRVVTSEITADVLGRAVASGLDPRRWTVDTRVVGA